MPREEHLYLLSPQGHDDLSLMVTVRLRLDRPQVVLDELERFFQLLVTLYDSLGGSPLRVTRLRQARLDTPRLELSRELNDREDIPLERFLAAFTRWIQQERESDQR